MFIVEALWFFLPILIANQCPGLASYVGLPGSRTPVNRKWLGENKTIGAYYVASMGAIATVYAQSYFENWSATLGLFDYNSSSLWFVGFLFGLGVVLGDHIKSFIKRRVGIPPGGRWWPFDQIDFVVGSVLLVTPVVGWIGWHRFSVLILVVLAIHPIGNWVGYQLGLRKVPW